jgi:hypothetical protein
MDHATIEDLEINPAIKLTPMVIKNLVDVVNEEFSRRQTIYDTESELKKEEILNQYKKAVGYQSLKKEYDKAKSMVEKAERQVKEVEKKMNLKGLDPDGTRHTVGHYSYHSNHYDNYEQRQLKLAESKIDKLLKTVETSGPENVRNKIVSRLWLAGTAGEAMVILRQVLGNGLIPSMSVKQIKALPKE